jgi:hypothetical protein
MDAAAFFLGFLIRCVVPSISPLATDGARRPTLRSNVPQVPSIREISICEFVRFSCTRHICRAYITLQQGRPGSRADLFHDVGPDRWIDNRVAQSILDFDQTGGIDAH